MTLVEQLLIGAAHEAVHRLAPEWDAMRFAFADRRWQALVRFFGATLSPLHQCEVS